MRRTRRHTACPIKASEDPEGPPHPKSLLLKGMPQTYKGAHMVVTSDSREKLKDLFVAWQMYVNKSLTLEVFISCTDRELNPNGSFRGMCVPFNLKGVR